jgi:hypothetical protein
VPERPRGAEAVRSGCRRRRRRQGLGWKKNRCQKAILWV